MRNRLPSLAIWLLISGSMGMWACGPNDGTAEQTRQIQADIRAEDSATAIPLENRIRSLTDSLAQLSDSLTHDSLSD